MSLPYFRMYPTDFEADTSHLTLIEDGAYNRLLRLCWSTPGCCIPDDELWIMRRMRARDEAEKEAIRTVLNEFFTRANQVVSNGRLLKEFDTASNRYDVARENGKKGGRKKTPLKTKEKNKATGLIPVKQNETGMKANQNHNQNHNKPPTHKGDFDDFWEACPRKIGKDAARKAWSKAVREIAPDVVLNGMKRHAAEVANTDPKFIPHPATWLNSGRWDDEPPKAKAKSSFEEPPLKTRRDISGKPMIWEGWPLGWCEDRAEMERRKREENNV